MTGGILEQLAQAGVVIALAVVVRFLLVFAIRRISRAMLAVEVPPEDAGDLGSKTRLVLARASGLADQRRRQRVDTVGSLLRNVVNVTVAAVALLTVLAIFGVPMGPLLASAGIGGIAVGFGAQSLVRDYISGIFLLLEDQFGIGDFVKVGAIEGTVMQVALRVTQVRGGDGTVWYVRNGEILNVGNVSQGYSTASVDVPVSIDEDPARVVEVLRGAVAGLEETEPWEEVLLAPPNVLGVSSITDGKMIIQISLKTRSNQQWGVMREVRMRAKQACADAGIRGPALPLGPVE